MPSGGAGIRVLTGRRVYRVRRFARVSRISHPVTWHPLTELSRARGGERLAETAPELLGEVKHLLDNSGGAWFRWICKLAGISLASTEGNALMEMRIPGSMRTRETLSQLTEGRLSAPDARSELVRLTTRLIIEETLEAESRDALGRGYHEHGGDSGHGYRNGNRTGRPKTAEGQWNSRLRPYGAGGGGWGLSSTRMPSIADHRRRRQLQQQPQPAVEAGSPASRR